MANDFRMSDPRLKDPIQGISDGFKEPVQDKTPGFFQSLRNPYHLMLEESLPASLYQWITGNTKKKQAQEALEFIRNNPQLRGSKLYTVAERKLQRFGYLLEDGDMHIDMKEVGNMIKKNPKLFGAELVNMLMADPWLMFMPLGWGKLGRGVVNSIRMKAGKRLQYKRLGAKTTDDLKVGAFATLATPFVFSTVWQGSEDRTLDPKRTTVETTIGATAGALFSVGFAGTAELARRATRLNRSTVNRAYEDILKSEGANVTDIGPDGYNVGSVKLLEKLRKEVNETFIDEPSPRTLNVRYQDLRSDQAMAFFRRTKEGAKEGTVYMDVKRIREAFEKKAWTKPKMEGVDPLPENQFKTAKEFQDFIYYHELGHWQNPILRGESRAAYENRMNRIALNAAERNKIDQAVAKDILNSKTKFDILASEMTVVLRQLYENGRDMSVASWFKGAASIGAVLGTAQFLTADDEKLLATAKGVGLGAGIYVAGRALFKGFKNHDSDHAALAVESALDASKIITVKTNSLVHKLSQSVKNALPDAIDSRRKVFYYLTGARGKWNSKTSQFEYNSKLGPMKKTDLSDAEFKVAEQVKDIFKEFDELFSKKGAGLYENTRANYLPLIWNEFNPKYKPFQFVNEFDGKIVTGQSDKFRFGQSRVFGDINKGLSKGGAYTIKEGMDDPAELIKIYGFAAAKALSTRSLIRHLGSTKLNNKPLLIKPGGYYAIDKTNYIQFDHPYFTRDGKTPWIHKGIDNALRMVFDATDEGQFMGALFTTNLMMKRLAVGFSFFHAGALVESMWFAGNKLNFAKKVLDPRSKKELQGLIDNPERYIKEFPHAVEQLKAAGFDDVIQFARGNGLMISTPEDVGFDRFYYNLRGLETGLKNHFGINTGSRAEKVFKWFDRITWDRVFTQAKLHTFLSALNKPTIMNKPNAMQIVKGDTQAQIYSKAQRAAQFANDAFGGQNWEMLANRIQTPWLKRMMQTTFAPGSRGYMQLLMFAPDWTISNIRIIAKSLPAFESDPALRRLYQYYFAKAAATYAVAGSALNYIFSGQSLLENTDPTRINLGNGEVLTFSKQLMEPFHWITAPQSTGLKKIGSLPRTTIEVLTNKQYLTTKWSPNITKKDDEAIEKGLKIGGQVGKRFLPIWLQQASKSVSDGLEREGLSVDLAADVSVDFVLGQMGHPRYKGPRTSQYKTKGLVRSPYETLF